MLLTVDFGCQGINPIDEVFEPAVGMNIEPVENLHSVVIGASRSEITRHTLDVLTDHDHRQQDQLKKGLRNPSMMPSPPGLRAAGSPMRAMPANT